jgi:hypothetical protein
LLVVWSWCNYFPVDLLELRQQKLGAKIAATRNIPTDLWLGAFAARSSLA